MAENINIDFMPNRKTADTQRVGVVEHYLKLLTDRTKFCFSSVYDDFADMGKRIEYLENYSLAMPSSVDLTVDSAVIIQEAESQQVVHNFTKVHYVDGNTIGYGDTPNTIICNGVLINSSQNRDYQNGSKYKYLSFPKGHSFNAPGVSARIESVTDIVVDVAVEAVYEAYKNLRSQITVTNAGNGGRAGFTLTRFSVDNGEDYAVFPYWNSISPPSEDYPYGSVQIDFDTIAHQTGLDAERQRDSQ